MLLNRTPLQKLAFLALPLALMIVPSLGLAAQHRFEGGSSILIATGPQAHQHIAQGEKALAPSSKAHSDYQQQMLSELGLTPEQSQKIKNTMEQGRAQSKVLRDQLKVKRQAMMQYLHSPNATEAGARTLNNDINDLQRRLSEIRLKTWFTMRSQLNGEQLQKFQALKSKYKAQNPQYSRSHASHEY